MKLKELLEQGYGSGLDFNCSETLLSGANIAYGLGLGDDCHKTASCFGGGMFIGGTCGAITGALMALGVIIADDRAHLTADIRKNVQDFFLSFSKKMGATDCALLKERYSTPEAKCRYVQLVAAETLDELLISLGIMDSETGEIKK